MKKNIFWPLLIVLIGLGIDARAQPMITLGDVPPAQAFWQYLGVHCAGLDAIELRILRLDPCSDLKIDNLGITPHGAFPNCVIVPNYSVGSYSYTFNQDQLPGTENPPETEIWTDNITSAATPENLKALIKDKLTSIRQEIVEKTQKMVANTNGKTCTCDGSATSCATNCKCNGACDKGVDCACKGKCKCPSDNSSESREGCVDFDISTAAQNMKNNEVKFQSIEIQPSKATFLRVQSTETGASQDKATCDITLNPVPSNCGPFVPAPTTKNGPSAPKDDPSIVALASLGLLDTIQIPSPCLCVRHPDTIIASVLDGLFKRDLDTIKPHSKLRFFQVTLSGGTNYKFTLNPAFDGEIAVYRFTNPDDYTTYKKIASKDFGVTQLSNTFNVQTKQDCETLRVVIGYHPCDIGKLDVKIEKQLP
jgi:hypothetical protein